MAYFIEDENLKLSQNIVDFLTKMNQYVNFEFPIYGSDNSLQFSIDTANLNLVQITKLLQTAKNLNSEYAEYDQETDSIDIIIPKRKLNFGSVAILFLLIRGVVWLKK